MNDFTKTELFLKIVGAENVKEVQGQTMLSLEGLRRLAQAVKDGKLEGNEEAAANLLKGIQGEQAKRWN